MKGMQEAVRDIRFPGPTRCKRRNFLEGAGAAHSRSSGVVEIVRPLVRTPYHVFGTGGAHTWRRFCWRYVVDRSTTPFKRKTAARIAWSCARHYSSAGLRLRLEPS